MGKNGKHIERSNGAVIDTEKGIDIAAAISKYTSGGVQLTDAIAELAKSLTILFKDQMGYTSFRKRHGSCMFDLSRECFHYIGHDIITGSPVKNLIHEWQSAGESYTFGDGKTAMTASRSEVKLFAKDLPAFLDKLRDDLMSSAAQSEGKAELIACLAERLRECNLVIFKRRPHRPEPVSFGSTAESVIRLIQRDNVDAEVEHFRDTAMDGIIAIDEADQKLDQDHLTPAGRHAEYAPVVMDQLRNAYIQGVDHGHRAQAIHDREKAYPGATVQDEDEVIQQIVDAAIAAICEIDREDVLQRQPGTDRRAKYTEAIRFQVRCAFRLAFRRGIDQGMAADQVGDDVIRVGPSAGASSRASKVVEAQRIDAAEEGFDKCPVCGVCKDILRLMVAGNVIAYLCPNGHSYLFSDTGAVSSAIAGYMEIPVYEYKDKAAFKGPVPVEGIRFFGSDRNGNVRRCVKADCAGTEHAAGEILDLFCIKVLGEPVAVIGLCSKAHTYLYLPSDYPATESIQRP